MAYPIETGLQISLDYDKDTGIGTWYKITDHNRQEIQANPTLIEKQSRMANGTMRKYVVASKYTISTSWKFIPVATKVSHIEKINNVDTEIVDVETVDGQYSAGWLSAFYNANVSRPIWIKLVNAKIEEPSINNTPDESTYRSSRPKRTPDDSSYPDTGSKGGGEDIYHVYITSFSTTTVKRSIVTDYVDMDIEFTEI